MIKTHEGKTRESKKEIIMRGRDKREKKNVINGGNERGK